MGTELGAAEVKDAPFFEGIDWRNLLCQKAAFVPQLDHDEDCSYFDPRTDRYHHEVEDDEDLDFELLHPLFGPPSASLSSASSVISNSSRSVSKEQLNEVDQTAAISIASASSNPAGEEVNATLTAAHARHTAERLHSAIIKTGTSSWGINGAEEEPPDEALFHAFASCTPRFSIALGKAALEISQSDGELKNEHKEETATIQDEITPTKGLGANNKVRNEMHIFYGLVPKSLSYCVNNFRVLLIYPWT